MSGLGFRFEAPSGWKVDRTADGAMASSDSELVQVATFPLIKPYTSALFSRVEKELTARMLQVAEQTGGKLDGRSTVTASGIRAHSFDVKVGDHVDQYTFVLRGRREFQLLCRRKSSHADTACTTLISSFSLSPA